jgi:hypothetical protein
MRSILAPLTWLGRVILWIPPLTPIGIWRSLRYSRKKGERRVEKRIEKRLGEQRQSDS